MTKNIGGKMYISLTGVSKQKSIGCKSKVIVISPKNYWEVFFIYYVEISYQCVLNSPIIENTQK